MSTKYQIVQKLTEMMQIHIQLQDLCTLNKFFIKVRSILSKFMQKHG